jgi:hypothetical protein
MVQKDLNEEIKRKAYDLYKEHGFKDGNDFIDWLEAERQIGEQSKSKPKKRKKSIKD